LCFHIIPLQNLWKGVYIVGFRSRRVRGAEVCNNWTHEGESGSHHMSQVLGRVVDPLFHLMTFFVDFFFSQSSISQKMTWKKDRVCLMF
jgi:hypothetical protein